MVKILQTCENMSPRVPKRLSNLVVAFWGMLVFWILIPLSAIIKVFEGLEGLFFGKNWRKNRHIKRVVKKSYKSQRNTNYVPQGSQLVSHRLPQGTQKSPKIDTKWCLRGAPFPSGAQGAQKGYLGCQNYPKVVPKWPQNCTNKDTKLCNYCVKCD